MKYVVAIHCKYYHVQLSYCKYYHSSLKALITTFRRILAVLRAFHCLSSSASAGRSPREYFKPTRAQVGAAPRGAPAPTGTASGTRCRPPPWHGCCAMTRRTGRASASRRRSGGAASLWHGLGRCCGCSLQNGGGGGLVQNRKVGILADPWQASVGILR